MTRSVESVIASLEPSCMYMANNSVQAKQVFPTKRVGVEVTGMSSPQLQKKKTMGDKTTAQRGESVRAQGGSVACTHARVCVCQCPCWPGARSAQAQCPIVHRARAGLPLSRRPRTRSPLARRSGTRLLSRLSCQRRRACLSCHACLYFPFRVW